MAALLPPFFNVQFFTDDGEPAAGYLLHTYVTGTTTPKDTYTDQGGGSTNSNPIELDASGRCNLWLNADGSEYRLALHTPADALIEQWDDVAGVPLPSADEFVPLAGGVTMTGNFELAGPATSALEPVTLDQMEESLADAAASTSTTILGVLPIGAVVMWVTGSVPTGFLALEGGNVSRTTYAALFALWGTTFGVGDGSTTFGLPDTRAYFMRGWDNGRGVDSGRALGSFQLDALQNMTGTVQSIDGGITADGVFATDGTGVSTVTSGVSGTHASLTFDASREARTAAETRPHNFAVRFIVRALAA